MPVIVLATSGRDVLIGQGAGWLVDTASDRDKKRMYDAQALTGFPHSPEGEMSAISKASTYAQSFGNNVQFTPLEWKPSPDRYSTRFLNPSDIHPPGFIKGTFPDKTYPNETPEAAARREFMEETWFPLDGYALREVAPQIFHVEIRPEDKKRIIDTRRSHGMNNELYELRWEPIVDIRKDAETLNPESKRAVPYLPARAGRRKTRRAIRRKVYKSRKQRR